jgi:hypothetical protein
MGFMGFRDGRKDGHLRTVRVRMARAGKEGQGNGGQGNERRKKAAAERMLWDCPTQSEGERGPVQSSDQAGGF